MTMRRSNSKCQCMVLVSLLVTLLLLTLFTYSPRYPEDEQVDQEKDHSKKEMVQPSIRPDLTSFLAAMFSRAVNVYNCCADDVHDDKRRKGILSDAGSYKHIIADKGRRFLYCPIPRTGSGSWQATLQLQGLAAASPQQLMPDGQPDDQFWSRLLVVRHPLSRLLSSYRSKFEDAINPEHYKSHGQAMMKEFRERPPQVLKTEVDSLLAKVDEDRDKEQLLGNLYANPVGPTFTEFVKYVLSPYDDEDHWRPFHEHCAPCAIQYNFIMRFEDMNEEGPKLLQYLYNSSDELYMKKVNVFNGPPTVEVSCSYYSQLSKALLSDLVGKYRVDMDLFGYSPDIYLKCADEYVEQ